jgi:hypothetical protein
MIDSLSTDKKGRLIWYADGSNTSKGTGAMVHWQYTTVLQAEVYTIKACVVENLDINYRNRNICILSAKL